MIRKSAHIQQAHRIAGARYAPLQPFELTGCCMLIDQCTHTIVGFYHANPLIVASPDRIRLLSRSSYLKNNRDSVAPPTHNLT